METRIIGPRARALGCLYVRFVVLREYGTSTLEECMANAAAHVVVRGASGCNLEVSSTISHQRQSISNNEEEKAVMSNTNRTVRRYKGKRQLMSKDYPEIDRKSVV